MFHYFGISKNVERSKTDELPTYSDITRDSNFGQNFEPVFGPEELSPPYLDYTQTVPINITYSNLSELPINSQRNKVKKLCTYVFIIIICTATVILFTTVLKF